MRSKTFRLFECWPLNNWSKWQHWKGKTWLYYLYKHPKERHGKYSKWFVALFSQCQFFKLWRNLHTKVIISHCRFSCFFQASNKFILWVSDSQGTAVNPHSSLGSWSVFITQILIRSAMWTIWCYSSFIVLLLYSFIVTENKM